MISAVTATDLLPHQLCENSLIFSLSFQHLVAVSLLIKAIATRVMWYFSVTLTCIPLITGAVCFFNICIGHFCVFR